MTIEHDKLIEMAKKAGAKIVDLSLPHESIIKNCYMFPTTGHLNEFAELIEASNDSVKRDLCRKVANQMVEEMDTGKPFFCDDDLTRIIDKAIKEST